MHNKILHFFHDQCTIWYRESFDMQKHDIQHGLRDRIFQHEINMMHCIYRIVGFARGVSERHSKKAKKSSMHQHHIDGYSSVDDYEVFLINDL